MISKAHPLSMILIVLWFSAMALIFRQLSALVILLLGCLLFLLGARLITGGTLRRSLLRLLPLMLMIMLIQGLAVKEGKLVLDIGFTSIHQDGLDMGIALSLRILLIFLAAKSLGRMSPMDFDAAFRVLRFPEEISFMVSYAVHLLSGISASLADARRGITKRGIDLKALKLKQKLRLYGIISLRLVSELLQGSEIRAIALELRGFRSGNKTSRLRVYRFSWRDGMIWIVLALGTLGLILLI